MATAGPTNPSTKAGSARKGGFVGLFSDGQRLAEGMGCDVDRGGERGGIKSGVTRRRNQETKWIRKVRGEGEALVNIVMTVFPLSSCQRMPGLRSRLADFSLS